tara:strand:+ start:788 stop:1165 length:378 start_codon:yes stop_codon:yes gene_type:complete
MGIRSDVGLALSRTGAEALRAAGYDVTLLFDTVDVIEGSRADIESGKVDPADIGAELHTVQDIKWYVDSYEDIKALYRELEKLDDEDYLLLQACSEYPDSGDDRGDYYCNPFDLCKRVSAVLNWC